jgi:lysophospholipase L1-like esterase
MSACILRGLVLLISLLGVTSTRAAPERLWVAVWTSAQYPATSENLFDTAALEGHTFRAIVHINDGGQMFRVRLSNAFGGQPLKIAAADIAIGTGPGRNAIVAATQRPLTFSGKTAVTIAPGHDLWSDPASLAAPAFSTLAVSILVAQAPAVPTGHGDARATSFLAPGDQAAKAVLTDARPVGHWYHLSAIAALKDGTSGTVLAVGDSITDSYMSTIDGNNRWPDILARRLANYGRPELRAVVNEGLGGNRILSDFVGPRLLDRLDRDVWSIPGVRTIILLEGVNDLGRLTLDRPASDQEHQRLVGALIDAYRTIIKEAHGRGIRILGGTITPYAGSDYHPDRTSEADRQQINCWIRTSEQFDAVIDFDAALRDPDRPNRLLPEFDSGDHIHPSVAGYRKMGEVVSIASLYGGPGLKAAGAAMPDGSHENACGPGFSQ